MMMSSRIRQLLSVLIMAIVAWAGEAASRIQQVQTSPVGRWKTVNDATGKAESVVEIWEEGGSLYGRIEKLLGPDPKYPNPLCIRCMGELKNKPVIGMRILWDLKRNGDEWSSGKVLDPNNGKSYRCRITVEDGGRKLKVRGYIGFSLLGRTQYWLRMPDLPGK